MWLEKTEWYNKRQVIAKEGSDEDRVEVMLYVKKVRAFNKSDTFENCPRNSMGCWPVNA